ncbi:hypothetical protein SAMD00019534_107240 [Acytostelium subglobosum LB1]|uniref:hypothetical protein n=1 Tax=Acytostelium subglobosum LB1 TaxID=1410327 RepID=UPI000644AA5A|nr:hypothetical protein SAMD00019534_107240 [Acytostelium subglobosum LB1]GAM27548.1 hypothetical protein SAMD00019534_107240 [Acytostelium subglobosum LB1]|eukprot:XP_012749613.1 hypothetical protein SAMD00019534_107240 [Acytostelium subglobosum LB1]
MMLLDKNKDIDKDEDDEDTNDGARFNSKSSMNRLGYQSIVELIIGCCGDHNRAFGDGTTTIVVMIGAMCQSAYNLIVERSIHPSVVARAFKHAMSSALTMLDTMAISIDAANDVTLEDLGECALNSKSIAYWKKPLTRLCIDAVQWLAASRLARRGNNTKEQQTQVELLPFLRKQSVDHQRWIGIVRVEGGQLSDTRLIRGVVLRRFLSSDAMPKVLNDVRVAVVSFPLEIPTPTTKHTLHLSSPEEMQSMLAYIQDYAAKVVSCLKALDVKLVVCQWGIDPSVNESLAKEGISALSWVSGEELERVALACGATISSSLERLVPTHIGHVTEMHEKIIGNDNARYTFLEGCDHIQSAIQTMLIRGGSEQMCRDAEECARDCLSVLANSLDNPKILVGGGVTELQLYTKLLKQQQHPSSNELMHDMAMKGWITSLLSIPTTLIENAGLDIGNNGLLWTLIKRYEEDDKCSLGANSSYGMSLEQQELIVDLSKQRVFELLDQKKSILQLATEAACMIMQIDSFLIV